MKNAKKGAPKKKDESNNSGSSGGQPSQANDSAMMGGGPRGQGSLAFELAEDCPSTVCMIIDSGIES